MLSALPDRPLSTHEIRRLPSLCGWLPFGRDVNLSRPNLHDHPIPPGHADASKIQPSDARAAERVRWRTPVRTGTRLLQVQTQRRIAMVLIPVKWIPAMMLIGGVAGLYSGEDPGRVFWGVLTLIGAVWGYFSYLKPKSA